MKITALLLTFLCVLGPTPTTQERPLAKWNGVNSLEPNYFSKAFPCPVKEDIFPCVCTFNSDTQELLMDCSAVKNETELKAVFSATFPNTAFTELRIENNAGLSVLGDVFGDVTFKRVYLNDVHGLRFITESSLFGSEKTLQKLEIMSTQLSTNTVPILTFGLYPNLTYFTFKGDGRKDSFPILKSNFLTYISIYNWDYPSLPVKAFQETPNVSVIGAALSLTEIIPGTFDGLPNLYWVNLNNNNIVRLLPGTLSVTRLTSNVYFANNDITTVDVGAFVIEDGAGSTVAATVSFSNNLLTTLESDVWRDLLLVIGDLNLRVNPLACGCDLAWLVLDPLLMAKVHPNSTCYDGTLLHDLDPVIYGDLC